MRERQPFKNEDLFDGAESILIHILAKDFTPPERMVLLTHLEETTSYLKELTKEQLQNKGNK